jgi:uncharacterized protein
MFPTPHAGVVVAQGNKTNGYGLYIIDNKMYFQVNQDGKAYQIASSTVLPGKFSFRAGLETNGTMRLYVDNKDAGVSKAAGLFKKPVTTPIRVGSDPSKGDNKVADYPDSVFFLRANLTNAKLETLEGIAAAPVAKAAPKIDQVITISTVKDIMKYDKTEITVKAGTTIQIVLNNVDFMQHNLVLIKPNTLKKLGAAADELARDPNGAKMQYVPKMPEVLQATPLVNPGQKFTLTFKVPDVAGDYPYVCTFPGHWSMMNGIMKVTK